MPGSRHAHRQNLSQFSGKITMNTLHQCGRLWLSAFILAMCACASRAYFFDYVKKPDAAFYWKIKSKLQLPEGTVYDLHLVSQVWQGITWEHQLQVYLPK